MMPAKITVVQFRAYDKPAMMAYLDKSPEEIHTALKNICSTYIPTAIYEANGIEFKPLSMLDDLIKNEPDKSLTEITKPTEEK